MLTLETQHMKSSILKMLGVFVVVVVVIIHESGATDSSKVRHKTNHLITGPVSCVSHT